MDTKKLIADSINHNPTGRVPMMYRADPQVNNRLIEYFNLGNIKDDWA